MVERINIGFITEFRIDKTWNA